MRSLKAAARRDGIPLCGNVWRQYAGALTGPWVCVVIRRCCGGTKGEIFVKDADERIIPKMKQIAPKLKARVVGDDGEDYK